MSPSWRSELQVLLQPQRVCVRRLSRGLAPRVVAQRSGDVTAGGGWQAAVDTLAALLAELPAAGSVLQVTLSSHFVRYALLPRSALLVSQADWLSFARQNFARVHGAAAESWQVAVDRGAGAGAAVACGFDAGLAEALRAAAAGARARLVSLQPALMAAFNDVRPRLATDAARLLVVEPGCVTLARIGDGGWLRLRAQRIDPLGAPAGQVSALLDRERVLDELPLDPEVALLVPLGLAASALEPAGSGSTILATAWAAFDAPAATREAAA